MENEEFVIDLHLIAKEVLEGRFDTIERLYQQRRETWWHSLNLTYSTNTSINFGVGSPSIYFNEYYSIILEQILIHKKMQYLLVAPFNDWLFLSNQVFCDYHPIHVFLTSLKIGLQEGLAWCNMAELVAQESIVMRIEKYMYYKISNVFLKHLDNDLFAKFIEYSRPHPMLYYRVGILMMVTVLENSQFLEKLDYSNLVIVRYLDDVLRELYKGQESITELRKTRKYSLCLFNIHEQYYQEQYNLSKAQSVIAELVLENKVPRDIVKYIVNPYL
jgi:hypothetical protein